MTPRSINIPQQINENKFLTLHIPQDPFFNSPDSSELFKKNAKLQDSDWYYRRNTVNYTINSDNFRSIEFSDIKWEDSIVLFGCSNVFGVGLSDEHTISAMLANITGIPVINLGISSSSITLSLHNSIILKDICPNPKAVVHVWSHYNRTVYYDDCKPENLGTWSIANSVTDRYWQLWVHYDAHGQSHALMASKTSKLVWANTNYYECSFFPENSELLNCDNVYIIDRARDLAHPGIESAKLAAETIAKNLNL